MTIGPSSQRPQIVLVLQGGGALGAYQFGVYQGLHEAGIEPDWVVGTSIGAINAALIACNPPALRLERMEAFWDRVTHRGPSSWMADWAPDWARAQHKLEVTLGGLSGFFQPHWQAWGAGRRSTGNEHTAFYRTDALRETLEGLLDVGLLPEGSTRMTVGAVNVRTGRMRYFDSRHETVGLDAVMASGALAPAFPAVYIDGEPYWDGGLYSNSPIEVVLDDKPRRDAIIFNPHLWRVGGDEPRSLEDIQERIKDIQFASRADTIIERQRQLHQLRRTVHRLVQAVPEELHDEHDVDELGELGSDTLIHVIRLHAPRLPDDDATKDIDFSQRGIAARRKAGLATVRVALQRMPWTHHQRHENDGMCVHEIGAVLG